VQGCGPPPTVVNAEAALYSATLVGSTAMYICNGGFKINGSDVIKCHLSGWEAEPQCLKGISTQFYIFRTQLMYCVCFCL